MYIFRYQFNCGKWVSLTKGEGKIYQNIPALGDEELKSFQTLMKDHAKLNLFEVHTWVSVFSRPNRSRFTRVQRLSTCLSVLFLAMVTSAMWYGTSTTDATDKGITIGPIRFTFQQLFISFICSIIIVPPNLIIVNIFKRLGPRSTRVHVMDVLKRMQGVNNESKAKNKRPFLLPWWFMFVGYFLVFACVFVSGFFIVFYSLQWGTQKSTEWLLSIVLSFTETVLIVQPIEVSENNQA